MVIRSNFAFFIPHCRAGSVISCRHLIAICALMAVISAGLVAMNPGSASIFYNDADQAEPLLPMPDNGSWAGDSQTNADIFSSHAHSETVSGWTNFSDAYNYGHPSHSTAHRYVAFNQQMTSGMTYPTSAIYDLFVSRAQFEYGGHVAYADSQVTPEPFVTTWATTAANESITIPVGGAAGQYTVDWGDGSQETVAGDASHQYPDAGTYTVSISGNFTRINLGADQASAQKLQSIRQWGGIQWGSMNNAFAGASNMVYNATDVPVLSGVTGMNGMFDGASSFDGDVSDWDVSGVTDMGGMFRDATSFDGDVSDWDVSGVTGMNGMFDGATSFDGDVSDWDVSGVRSMDNMFRGATSFDGDVSDWDVSGVRSMDNMFRGATSFDGDVSEWHVSGVRSMDNMFRGATSFDGDVLSWDVSGVTGMNAMFRDASSFDGDVSYWDVSGVTGMNAMFSGATSFDGDVSDWDVSGVTDMRAMFRYASSFNGDISDWDVSGATGMGYMFFAASSFNGDISDWDVSGATGMSDMFYGAGAFDQNLGKWYIVLDDQSIDDGDSSRTVASISAQNRVLGGQSTGYSIAPGGDGGAFEISGSDLKLKSVPDHASKSSYTVTISSDGGFGASNSVTFDIFVDPVIPQHRPFVTTWATTAANESITIPVGGAAGQYTVDWGDGSQETITGDASHQYPDAGTYTVSISGNFTRINLGADQASAQKLQSIRQWGGIQWGSMNNAFAGASNMVYNATDVPVLPGVTDMGGMFFDAASFNGDVSGWDVSGVTGMNGMFFDAASFNGDVSGWDVSGVTDMRAMFSGATSFDGDVSDWDVSGVTDMRAMFSGATSFDGDVSDWDVSGVTDIDSMFRDAASFNGDVSGWDVSGVTDMSDMFFAAASFNGDVSEWDVLGVTDMRYMFHHAEAFNGDVSEWHVLGVTDMQFMFSGATSFDGDVSGWDVSGVTDMRAMFSGATSFDGDISYWDVSGVTGMNGMFDGADAFDQNLGRWYIVLDDQSIDDGDSSRTVASISAQNRVLGGQSTGYSIAPGGDGGAFEISGSDLKLKSVPDHASKSSYTVTISSDGGFGASNSVTFDIFVDPVIPQHRPFVTTWATTAANESITIPVGGAAGQYTVDWGDGSQETVAGDASHQYPDAGTYTVSISGNFTRINLGADQASAQKLQSIRQWGGIQWGSMTSAFAGASNMVYDATDEPVLSGVTGMNGMFDGASSFNGDLSEWDVSGVTGMNGMFDGATSFDGDVSEWDVSGVTGMNGMFDGATSFDGDVLYWDVSGVRSMDNMFRGATSFDGDVLYWDVSGVRSMDNMFSGATSFNGDVSEWHVSGVRSMDNMFRGATSFDGDISSWNVSGVTGMNAMFRDASSFDGDVSDWDVSGVTGMNAMFSGATSFDGDVSDWDVSGVTDMRAMFRYASSFNGDISDWDVSGATGMGYMFFAASSFNGDVSDWDVSGATGMSDMFYGAGAFDQNLGKWYIVLDDQSIDDGDSSRTVASISAQNRILGGQSAGYGIAPGGDGGAFEISGSDLKLKSVPDHASKSSYTVTISSDGGFGASNSVTFDIFVDPVIPQHRPFVTTWATTAANESITIPVGGAAGQYTVDWGDGSQETVAGDASHQYPDAGTYTVSISGDFTRIHLRADQASAQKLQSIQQWGSTPWSSMSGAFLGAANMVYNATDVPVLSGVRHMGAMFHGATSFNGDVSDWDVSGVTDMHGMFLDAASFNGDVSDWDVSGVRDMGAMFYRAEAFNGDVSDWDVSGVTDMRYMFLHAEAFNGDISSWNVSGVRDMGSMFRSATSFNGDVSDWDVSGVTNMDYMFSGATSFNGDVSEWDVSGVRYMGAMFRGATSFNGDVSEWDVSGVRYMGAMFLDAASFNGDISDWNVSGVTDMHGMFFRATSFNGDVSEWDVSGVRDMDYMFFRATSFNGDVSEWDVSGVRDMDYMFFRATSFNGDVSEWDVSGVRDMDYMFFGADAFDQNLGKWYVVLGDYSIDDGDPSRTVASISAQNRILGGQSTGYSIAPGGDGGAFEIVGSDLKLKSVPDHASKSSYTVTISSGGGFGTSNSATFEILVDPTGG